MTLLSKMIRTSKDQEIQATCSLSNQNSQTSLPILYDKYSQTSKKFYDSDQIKQIIENTATGMMEASTTIVAADKSNLYHSMPGKIRSFFDEQIYNYKMLDYKTGAGIPWMIKGRDNEKSSMEYLPLQLEVWP